MTTPDSSTPDATVLQPNPDQYLARCKRWPGTNDSYSATITQVNTETGDTSSLGTTQLMGIESEDDLYNALRDYILQQTKLSDDTTITITIIYVR